MFTYLHGVVVPTSVYAASADWGSGADAVKALPDRIERAAGEFAALVSASDRSAQVKDPFALDGDFGSLIGGFQAE
jgi:FMN reductase